MNRNWIRGSVLLMRYAPIIGYSNGRRLVTVAARCHSAAVALQRARNMGGGPYWVAAAKQPAHRSVRQSGPERSR